MAQGRNFPNFLDAFFDYARDGFCPDPFHLWTGISIVSAALERKVWLNENGVTYYPNTFVLLVGHPGIGKSTAIRRGISLVERMKAEENPEFKLLSGLATQAGLISEMSVRSSFQLGPQITQFSSLFFYAGEASDSALQNLHGDFNATITAMYDCEDVYRKRLKDVEYVIPNPSVNLLAGSTFDFLKTLVNQNSVMGGLASRFTYVVSKERKRQEDPGSLRVTADPTQRDLLYGDLCRIHKLTGQFRSEKGIMAHYKKWWTHYQDEFLALESERMQSIMTRKPTLLKKLCMIISAAQRDDLILTEEHFLRAVELTEEVMKDNWEIISAAVISNKTTNEAVNQFILSTVHQAGGQINPHLLKKKFIAFGGDIMRFDSTLKMMEDARMLQTCATSGISEVKLLVDPYSNL